MPIVACSLILLNKCPGAYPVSIGDVLCRTVLLKPFLCYQWWFCTVLVHFRSVQDSLLVLRSQCMPRGTCLVIAVVELHSWWMLLMHLIVWNAKLHSTIFLSYVQPFLPSPMLSQFISYCCRSWNSVTWGNDPTITL